MQHFKLAVVLGLGACVAPSPDGAVPAGPVPTPTDGPGAVSEARPAAGATDAAEAVVSGSAEVAAPSEAEEVRLGIDVLAARGFEPIRGMRVGLITNHTGRNGAGESSIDVLFRHPEVHLVALFGPEHGIRGTEEAGKKVESGRDAETGLPIHSLYGQTQKPTPEMLRGLDALVFDIQDIGTRYYTYVWTMALALQAAAEEGLRFVVLDRPNPLGGAGVQGNVLAPEYKSFVGLYPVPMRHGLTAGELARLLNDEFGIGADLVVIPVEGWRRDRFFDQTGLAWIPPSPNMPSLESAIHYPGTCLFEGTNLSVGRGTPQAFQQIGAPWLDHAELVRRLESYAFPGVKIEAVVFTPDKPGDGRYGGQEVRGIRFTVTDRDRYDPTVVSIAALVEIRKMHPDRFEWRVSHFDRLAGTDAVRKGIIAGRTVEEITAGWADQVAGFLSVREKYLLYP